MKNIQQTEKVIQECDRMGLVQALTILHEFRDYIVSKGGSQSELVLALNEIFVWIDDMVILLNKFGGDKNENV